MTSDPEKREASKTGRHPVDGGAVSQGVGPSRDGCVHDARLAEKLDGLRELGEWATSHSSGLRYETERDELTLFVDSDKLYALCRELRDDHTARFATLVDITAVDRPNRTPRFTVVYHLLAIQFCQRVRIAVEVSEEQPVPSVVNLWPAASWYEREVWDLFGIFFDGNDDLRRIMTDYGFEGHPLRKDFPLTGYSEVRYDETEGRVVYDPVHLTQDFRHFDFTSPWEGPADGSMVAPNEPPGGGPGSKS